MPYRSNQIPNSKFQIPSGCFLLVALLLGTAPAVAGGAGTVRVEPAYAKRMEAVPGQVITAVFRVSNTLDVPRTFAAAVDLPQDWRLVMPLADFTLPPGGQEIRLVSFQVPTRARAAEYEVRYAARDRADAEAFDFGIITISVLPVYQINLQAIEAPRFVEAGETYQAVFLAVNEGNVDVTVELEATSGAGFPMRLDVTRLSLPAGATHRFVVTVSPERELAHKLRHILRVAARVREAPGVTVRATSAVDVMPASGDAGGLHRTLPVSLTLQAVGNNRTAGGQVKLAGAGEALGGQVDFQVSLPDQRQAFMYGDRGEYGLRYVGERVSLALGDQVYTLSPLTQIGRFGFGAGGAVRAGRFTLGGYHMETRYYFPPEQQQAASLAYDAGRFATFSANYLNREGLFSGDTFTLRSVLTPTATTQLDAECGLEGTRGQGNGACAFRLHGNHPWLSYAAQYVHADPDYPGYYRHQDVKSASLMVRPRPWMRLEGAWHAQDQGLADDASRAYRRYRLGGGLTGRPAGQSVYAFLYYRNQQWVQVFGEEALARSETAVQLRAGYNRRRVGLMGSVEHGRSEEPALGRAGAFQRYQMQARWTLRPGQDLGASVEYLGGTTLYRAVPQRQWLARLNANVGLTRRTRVMFNLYGSLDRSTSSRAYRAVQAQLEHAFPFGHRVSVQGFYRSFGALIDEGTADYVFAYTIPLHLPAPQRKAEKRLRGRVVDAETGSGVQKALLLLGEASTLTDAAGRFSFPMPPSGTHYLRLDRLSAGLDRISVQDMPLAVHADGAVAEPEIEIVLVRSARLSGRIAIQAENAADEQQGLFQAVLELVDAGGRHRILTDRGGHFTFEEVRPGPLTLRVVHARLPAYHYLEQEVYALSLTPGGHQDIQIRVLPRQRQIRMIDGGAIMAGQPAARPAPATRSTPGTDRPPGTEASQPTAQPAPSTGTPLDIERSLSEEDRSRDGWTLMGSETEARAAPAAETLPDADHPSREEDRSRGGWTLVVGSETDAQRADLIVRNFRYALRDTGHPVDVFAAPREGGVRYRVGVGLFATKDEASAVLTRLASRLPNDAWMLNPGAALISRMEDKK